MNDLNQAIGVLIWAAEKAQQKGAYNFDEAAAIINAINFIKLSVSEAVDTSESSK